MMISGTENLCDIFSIFHDGEISHFAVDGANLDLEVEIMYLAERVNPNYRRFRVSLQNVKNLSFQTWPKDPHMVPVTLSSPKHIFKPELEILSGELDGNLIKVICNQALPSCEYCGGELYLQADHAVVRDEGDREYSIDDLRNLSKDYWDEWSKRNSL
ncbi:MAG: hypothetical protein V4582_10705 [Pseudomonadota bacterium]